MPQTVNLILIVVLSVVPLYAVLRRARWSPRTTKLVMAAVPLLLFPLNAPLHEALHIVGTWLMGGTVGQVRLLQRFWVPGAPVPMIESPGPQTATARFVAAVLPYAADAALLAIAIRGFEEEKLLVAELAGYEAYREKVRYRILPHVW